MPPEIGPNLSALLIAFLALIGTLVGTIVTALLSYHNGKRIRQVEKNTNGMTEKMVASAYEEGLREGREEARKTGTTIT